MSASAEPAQRTGRNEIVPTAAPPHHYPNPERGATLLGVEAEPQHAAARLPRLDDVSLDELGTRIVEAHQAGRRASADVVHYAIRAGQLLLEARARVPAGTWGKWLASNCRFRDRTAQDYMRISRAVAQGLLDPQHAAESLRGVLAQLRPGREGVTDDDGAAGLVAWDKARQRFISRTRNLAVSDTTVQEQFRAAVRETISCLSQYVD